MKYKTVMGLKNSHCIGVDSIVTDLHENGSIHKRVFIAHPHHQLGHNSVGNPYTSVAYHNHHCAVYLEVLQGEITNITARRGSKKVYNMIVDSYQYYSPLSNSNEPPRFELIEKDVFIYTTASDFKVKERVLLNPEQFHTIYVKAGKMAVWSVTELKRFNSPVPLAYTKTDLTKFDFNKINTPMTDKEYNKALEYVRQRNTN
jgi:hypothetical protein